jgi:hypothetical protein
MEKEDNVLLKFAGVAGLDDDEKRDFNNASEKNFAKLKRKISGLKEVLVHVKVYNRAGDRKKFSLNVKCKTAKGNFESKGGVDWILSVAVKKAFSDILSEFEHRNHSDK